MPIIGSRGGGSAGAYGFAAGAASPYIIATGGTITESGDYRIHTFTSPGTFSVSSTGFECGANDVDYLVIAGGGGGGGPVLGGGGGAGGYRESSGTANGSYSVSPLGSGVPAITITKADFPIVVGAGGGSHVSGSPSSFSTITSAGGGRGGNCSSSGGSGGGAGHRDLRGEGNTPPVSPSQGQPGGGAAPGGVPSPFEGGSGGGGAITAGTTSPPGPSSSSGAGGPGASSSINASSVQELVVEEVEDMVDH